jgi:hypothetical protein
MATAVDDDIATQQHQVQRLLGRCLLRLQQYERLLKAVVAEHDLSGTLRTFESNRAARIGAASTRTLGQLAEEMFGAVVFAVEADDPACGDGAGDEVWIRARVRMQLSEPEYAAQRAEMKQLVGLRNRLVHHFIEDHDLWTVAGCQAAQQALVDAYGRIDQHVQRLGRWAMEMQQARQQMAALIQTDAVTDYVVDGIMPDGSVFWPGAGIVQALRAAAGELGHDGWTRVADAGAWITSRHPGQLPARYRCRSWRHALHESGLFELRRREVDGQRSTWYRERAQAPGSTFDSSEAASA